MISQAHLSVSDWTTEPGATARFIMVVTYNKYTEGVNCHANENHHVLKLLRRFWKLIPFISLQAFKISLAEVSEYTGTIQVIPWCMIGWGGGRAYLHVATQESQIFLVTPLKKGQLEIIEILKIDRYCPTDGLYRDYWPCWVQICLYFKARSTHPLIIWLFFVVNFERFSKTSTSNFLPNTPLGGGIFGNYLIFFIFYC